MFFQGKTVIWVGGMTHSRVQRRKLVERITSLHGFLTIWKGVQENSEQAPEVARHSADLGGQHITPAH